jgi:prepilin-type N-terminal cleavage/methylation domain-containing protein
MRRRQRGFTLIEVMISLAILGLVMSAVSVFFLGSMRQFKVQSRIAQTGIDSLIGGELLRKDVEHAGYGLPWNNIPAYNDAASGILSDSNVAPRGIVSVNGGGLNGSDYLVIKAVNVGTSDACKKWTTLQVGDVKRSWTTVPPNVENLGNSDRVIVMSPGSTGANWRSLVVPAGWSTTFGNSAAYQPATAADTRVIYGIDGPSGNPLRMPFNRADYTVSTANVPLHCAPNTGVLVKSVVKQSDGSLDTALPLIDCVASMQVQFDLDTDGDGAVDPLSGYENDLAGLTAAEIRDQVKQIRISLLAHEGQQDPKYIHPVTSISLGDVSVDLTDASFLGKGRNYRWKVYTLSVTPQDLGG